MITKAQRALQCKDDKGNWRWVFCQCNGKLIFTNTRGKALLSDYDLEYFRAHYGNNEFRAEKNGQAV